MWLIYSIIYGKCTDTMKQKLETLPAFSPIKEKQDYKSTILLLNIINSIYCNFESEKNKVLVAIQTQKKIISWRQSEGSTIAECNDQFMNQERVAEACVGTIQLLRVVDVSLKDKRSEVSLSQLESTAENALNNEVRE